MGPVSIGMKVQWNTKGDTDGDTPSIELFAAHLLRLSFLFALYHEIWIYVLKILKEETHQNLAL